MFLSSSARASMPNRAGLKITSRLDTRDYEPGINSLI